MGMVDSGYEKRLNFGWQQAKEAVLKRFPGAYFQPISERPRSKYGCVWHKPNGDAYAYILGSGSTEEAAWIDAAKLLTH